MSGIVCAIRGGPGSQPTIAQAIALAEKTSLPLHFLFVVNLDFMTHTSSSRVHTISRQMDQMGEFILLAAQAAAARQGVSAQGVVRHGNVGEEIIGLCQDIDADYVILGRPQERTEGSVFPQHLLTEFGERVESETRAKVVLTEAGST